MASTYHALAELLRSKPLIAILALFTHYIAHSAEWESLCYLILRTWALAFGGIAAITYMAVETLTATIQVTTMIASIYFSVLVTSVLLHRGLFHRLRKVCGLAMDCFFLFHHCFSVILIFLTDQPSSQDHFWHGSPSFTGFMLASFQPNCNTSSGNNNCTTSTKQT